MTDKAERCDGCRYWKDPIRGEQHPDDREAVKAYVDRKLKNRGLNRPR